MTVKELIVNLIGCDADGNVVLEDDVEFTDEYGKVSGSCYQIEKVIKHGRSVSLHFDNRHHFMREQMPKTGEWIDVKDRKPERTAWIICTDGINISVEKYKKDGIDHFFPRGRWFDTEDMVAWQPLPQPYKVESEE